MDPLSAMQMTAAGRIMPFNPPVLDQAPKIAPDEIKQLGNINLAQPQNLANLPTFHGPANGRSFSDFLGQMVSDVNAKQATANKTVEGVLNGDNVPLHQAMLSVEEASVSFQLMVEVRNKLLDSYQELMRMQI